MELPSAGSLHGMHSHDVPGMLDGESSSVSEGPGELGQGCPEPPLLPTPSATRQGWRDSLPIHAWTRKSMQLGRTALAMGGSHGARAFASKTTSARTPFAPTSPAPDDACLPCRRDL